MKILKRVLKQGICFGVVFAVSAYVNDRDVAASLLDLTDQSQ